MHRFREVLQTEAAECGLACLTMIANAHGHELDLPAMRRRFSLSMRGMTLTQLIEAAHDLGLDSRPLRIELEYLREIKIPCILHWNMNHFVVLTKVKRNAIEIIDPASGVRTISMQEVDRSFTGVAVEFSESDQFRPIKDTQAVQLRSVTGPISGIWKAFFQILSFAIGLELITIIFPLYTQVVLDQVLTTADVNLLSIISLAFIAIIFFRLALAIARSWVITWASGKIGTQWMANLFAHLLRLPLSYFEKRHVGDISSRFNSIQFIRQTVSGNFIEAILNGLTGVIVLIVVSIYSIPLTCIVLGSVLLYLMLRWTFLRRLWLANEEQIIFGARQTTFLVESIRGAQAVKLAGREGIRSARFSYLTLNMVQREIQAQRINLAFSSISQCLFAIQKIAVIWVGSRLIISGNFSIGMMVAFLAYSDQLSVSVGGFIDRCVEFRMLRLHMARIADISLEPPEQSNGHGQCDDDLTPQIDIDNVSFRYGDNEAWVLRNCSLSIPAGMSLAITGQSGCGKTTLIKLILGLLEPTEGAIRVNGVDIRLLGISSYRKLIGSVMQDDQLFDGSIADNIAFFDREATPEIVIKAAEAASVHEEIIAMPMGYNTLVGDMGASLSGGQKQRILLARAMYRNPKILILDEATSHLDISREKEVNESIKRMNVTRIIIAHRPETIASADRTYILSNLTAEASTNVTRDSENARRLPRPPATIT